MGSGGRLWGWSLLPATIFIYPQRIRKGLAARSERGFLQQIDSCFRGGTLGLETSERELLAPCQGLQVWGFCWRLSLVWVHSSAACS